MSKFTPGPWSVGNTDPLLFGRKQGNGTEPIGFVYGPAFHERSEVGQRALANARLIAASPRMYEVVKRGALAGDTECLSIMEAIDGTGEQQ